MLQRTFSIVKPDAVRNGYTAGILAELEKAGFKLVSIKRMSLTEEQAKGFYHVHAERPFFGDLTKFMASGPMFPDGAGEGKCHCRPAEADGGDEPGECGRGNDSEEVCGVDRGECDPWVRWGRDRGV